MPLYEGHAAFVAYSGNGLGEAEADALKACCELTEDPILDREAVMLELGVIEDDDGVDSSTEVVKDEDEADEEEYIDRATDEDDELGTDDEVEATNVLERPVEAAAELLGDMFVALVAVVFITRREDDAADDRLEVKNNGVIVVEGVDDDDSTELELLRAVLEPYVLLGDEGDCFADEELELVARIGLERLVVDDSGKVVDVELDTELELLAPVLLAEVDDELPDKKLLDNDLPGGGLLEDEALLRYALLKVPLLDAGLLDVVLFDVLLFGMLLLATGDETFAEDDDGKTEEERPAVDVALSVIKLELELPKELRVVARAVAFMVVKTYTTLEVDIIVVVLFDELLGVGDAVLFELVVFGTERTSILWAATRSFPFDTGW